jgi:hypothetical protein
MRTYHVGQNSLGIRKVAKEPAATSEAPPQPDVLLLRSGLALLIPLLLALVANLSLTIAGFPPD